MSAAEEQRGVVIQCGSCKTTVLGELAGFVEVHPPPDDGEPYKAMLLRCPACDEAIVGVAELDLLGYPAKPRWEWGRATRVWPQPMNYLDWAIPERVRASLEEARKCVDAGSPLASAVMVRRALEAVTNQFGVKSGTLPTRLRELRETGVIDARMFEWAESLRKHGNLGAHDSDGNVSEEDARDLLEFAEAICEYVFVLTRKFAAFQSRQAKRAAPIGNEGETAG